MRFYAYCRSNNSGNVGASGANNPGNNNTASGLIGGGTSTAAAKNQLEQLTTMRDALFSQGKMRSPVYIRPINRSKCNFQLLSFCC